MTTLRSLLFNLLFALWTGIIFLISLPTLFMPRPAVWRMGGLWVRGSLFLLRTIVGLGHRVRGGEHRAAGPAIYLRDRMEPAAREVYARELTQLKAELQTMPIARRDLVAKTAQAIDGTLADLQALASSAPQ